MTDIYLTNTLSREKEKFEPINPPNVGMYTCGITAYDFAHIGHGRKYVTDDVLRRVLTANGYKVNLVQNVTDVGHLVSDSDEGEDKMEKGAKKAGKTVWEVAEFFTKDFYEAMDSLNIIRPSVICKATDHIPEQIEMIGKLIKKGFAYETPEAVYFDVTKYPKYDGLFGQKLSDKKVAVRESVIEGEYKKSPQDFALWFKRIGRFKDHQMYWDSPWGDGFPGWHIECSAMSVKYLGPQFDIHTGGEDHISVHHPNEIAQSEASTGESPFVRYWIHTAFLTVDGTKMSKSLGNVYSVSDIEKKGFYPLSLRYLYLMTHYRDPMNFTWESLTAAQNALVKIWKTVNELHKTEGKRVILSSDKNEKIEDFRNRFLESVNDDLNTPKALGVMWEALKSNVPSTDKLDFLLLVDDILGLWRASDIAHISEEKEIPHDVQDLMNKREELRVEKKFDEADKIRKQIEELGFKVQDTK